MPVMDGFFSCVLSFSWLYNTSVGHKRDKRVVGFESDGTRQSVISGGDGDLCAFGTWVFWRKGCLRSE